MFQSWAELIQFYEIGVQRKRQRSNNNNNIIISNSSLTHKRFTHTHSNTQSLLFMQNESAVKPKAKQAKGK